MAPALCWAIAANCDARSQLEPVCVVSALLAVLAEAAVAVELVVGIALELQVANSGPNSVAKGKQQNNK